MPTFPQAAAAYVRRIRNPLKQAYAQAYASFVATGGGVHEPAQPTGLSYMAAQAVRMDLHRMEYAIGTGTTAPPQLCTE